MESLKICMLEEAFTFTFIRNLDQGTVKLGDKELFGRPKIVP